MKPFKERLVQKVQNGFLPHLSLLPFPFDWRYRNIPSEEWIVSLKPNFYEKGRWITLVETYTLFYKKLFEGLQ